MLSEKYLRHIIWFSLLEIVLLLETRSCRAKSKKKKPASIYINNFWNIGIECKTLKLFAFFLFRNRMNKRWEMFLIHIRIEISYAKIKFYIFSDRVPYGYKQRISFFYYHEIVRNAFYVIWLKTYKTNFQRFPISSIKEKLIQ